MQRVYRSCGVPYNPHIAGKRPNTAPSPGSGIRVSGFGGQNGAHDGRMGFGEGSIFEGDDDDAYESVDIPNDMEPLHAAHLMGPQLEEMFDIPLMNSGIVPHETTSENTDKLITAAAIQTLPIMANEKTTAQRAQEGEFNRKQMRIQFTREQALLQETIRADKLKDKSAPFDHQKLHAQAHKRKQSQNPKVDSMDSISYEFTLT